VKIDNYSVAMNAQYYNVEFRETEASLSNITQNFTKEEPKEATKIELTLAQTQDVNRQLSQKLSKALLKNISNASQRLVGDRVELSSTYMESQSLNFSLSAFIQAEGKEIEVALDVSLSRSFVQKMSITMSLQGPLKDPLIISLDGTMPTLSSNSFSFDIDSDGKSDQISQLSSGNGFLVLDKNKNGIIDNGSELFGTKSGDGFTDLSKYDEDKNGWIDENDAIFDKLQIWQKTESEDKLIGLGEVGIGAIFLGNTETPFSLKSETNQLLGEIKKSSFVLFESGKAGVISQLDLAVENKTKESLSTVESIQKDISSLNLTKLYKSEDEGSVDTTDGKMQKIQAQIKALESDLRGAKESDKPGIQARIGVLFAQMMSLLEAELR